eukprot:TRINITY_DN80_c0_g4_i1.p1 TRINITY_DN80_c0_g4~~TRINITY_DN80_c0_g4_i1.p1  ORF type:complete len:296 (+),score=71.69 TRINITY_DN80_c0_g4_i1:63-950(+)
MSAIIDSSTPCCLCFDPLGDRPVCTLWKAGAQVCPHYFHVDCAEGIRAISTRGYGMNMEVEGRPDSDPRPCPICRAIFLETKAAQCPEPPPPPPPPAAVPVENGKLHDALKAMLDADDSVVASILGGRGTGIQHPGAPPQRDEELVPALEDHDAWWEFWVGDGDGAAMSRAAMLSALVATYERYGTVSDAGEAREVLGVGWDACAPKGGGMTKAEFFAADGLAELVLAALQNNGVGMPSDDDDGPMAQSGESFGLSDSDLSSPPAPQPATVRPKHTPPARHTVRPAPTECACVVM